MTLKDSILMYFLRNFAQKLPENYTLGSGRFLQKAVVLFGIWFKNSTSINVAWLTCWCV